MKFIGFILELLIFSIGYTKLAFAPLPCQHSRRVVVGSNLLDVKVVKGSVGNGYIRSQREITHTKSKLV